MPTRGWRAKRVVPKITENGSGDEIERAVEVFGLSAIQGKRLLTARLDVIHLPELVPLHFRRFSGDRRMYLGRSEDARDAVQPTFLNPLSGRGTGAVTRESTGPRVPLPLQVGETGFGAVQVQQPRVQSDELFAGVGTIGEPVGEDQQSRSVGPISSDAAEKCCFL